MQPSRSRSKRSSPALVDFEQVERLARDVGRYASLMAHLGHVADATQNPVGDARRSARTGRDQFSGVLGDIQLEAQWHSQSLVGPKIFSQKRPSRSGLSVR